MLNLNKLYSQSLFLGEAKSVGDVDLPCALHRQYSCRIYVDKRGIYDLRQAMISRAVCSTGIHATEVSNPGAIIPWITLTSDVLS